MFRSPAPIPFRRPLPASRTAHPREHRDDLHDGVLPVGYPAKPPAVAGKGPPARGIDLNADGESTEDTDAVEAGEVTDLDEDTDEADEPVGDEDDAPADEAAVA
jgi:hypothetical protein